MRTIKPVIGTIFAVAVAASPLASNVVFAAEGDVEETTAVEETVESTCEAAESTCDTACEASYETAVQESVTTAYDTVTETIYAEAVNNTEETENGTAGESEGENTEANETVSNTEESAPSNNNTIIVRGVPEGCGEETTSIINEYMPKIMETGNKLNINNPGFIDAEKYNVDEKGYDSNHCWAATASNILWTTGYAQQAVNPMTGAEFKSEDEVLTYFSEHFTDEAGNPEAAIEWFFKGTYRLNDIPGVAHTKDNESKGLLPNVKYDSFMKSVFNDAEEMKSTYDIGSQGMGVLVRWLERNENGKYVLSKDAHWVTANGVVLDNEQEEVTNKVKALVIADSDDAPVNGDLSATSAEKTVAKSGQKNTYSVYKLTYNKTLGVWGLNNFHRGFGVITYLYGLKDADKVAGGNNMSVDDVCAGGSVAEVPAEVKNYVDMINRGEIKVSNTDEDIYIVVENAASQDSEEENMIISAFTEKDLMKKENVEMLRKYMIKNNKSAYVVNNGKVDGSKNCTVYVNAIDTMVYNVSVDGDVVPFKSVKVIDTKANMAKVVIDKEYMKTLGKGTHEIQIDVENMETAIDYEIEVM